MNANLIFKWLRDERYAPPIDIVPEAGSPVFLPIEIEASARLKAHEVKAQALMIEKLQHQLQLFAENEDIAKSAAEVEQTAPAEPIEPKEKPRRKPLPGHLDRIEQVLSAGEDCPDCGGDLSKLGEDVTEELEYIPGRFVVNKIIRPIGRQVIA